MPVHQEQDAREILNQFAQSVSELEQIEGEEEPHAQGPLPDSALRKPLNSDLKRALFAALFGSLILPVIMNAVSLWLLLRTYRRTPSGFTENPIFYGVTTLLNAFWFVVMWAAVRHGWSS